MVVALVTAAAAAKDNDDGDADQDIQSPTETIIAYYDDNHAAYDCGNVPLHNVRAAVLTFLSDKALPFILPKHTSISKKPLPPLYIYTSFDSAVELPTLPNHVSRSFPPIASSHASPPISPSSPRASPSPPTKKNQLPTIQHVQKRYNGFLGFLTRTYILHTIVVSRTLLSPYLYAARDLLSGEKKAVLKLIVMSSHQHGFHITFPPYKQQQHSRNNDTLYAINDRLLVFHLVQWIKYQPLIPLLVHAKHIYRDGHKLYIVYNHQLLQ
ncbi:Fe(2+) transporter [Mucor velutinosus]|uniref:Fe(2+) transporter n=1 Tax=Mucor velutinosus TaxID=708070 RepID=A0AAN7DN17_9FUNG|nr:Fe(2+) transporter [Mucor velutinosus]